jgi:hypothetical protein
MKNAERMAARAARHTYAAMNAVVVGTARRRALEPKAGK